MKEGTMAAMELSRGRAHYCRCGLPFASLSAHSFLRALPSACALCAQRPPRSSIAYASPVSTYHLPVLVLG
jgi:hypothetical protein